MNILEINKISKFLKYCVVFVFIIILLVINAKFSVSLQTTAYPKHKNDYIPGCPVKGIINQNESDPNNSSIERPSNEKVIQVSNNTYIPENSYNSNMSNEGTSRYVLDKDYNKFYWGNN